MPCRRLRSQPLRAALATFILSHSAGDLVLDDATAGGCAEPGRPIATVPYWFSLPRAAPARGRLVVAEPDDWSPEACPPRYVGTVDVVGAIVVHVDPPRGCPLEATAAAVANLSAAAWLSVWEREAVLGAVPGRKRGFYERLPRPAPVRGADGQPFAAMDATQDAVVPLLRKLRDLRARGSLPGASTSTGRSTERGSTAMPRAVLEPSPSAWARARRRTPWFVWQVALLLGAAMVLEVCVGRMYLFASARTGNALGAARRTPWTRTPWWRPRLSVLCGHRAVLGLQLVLALLRIVDVSVDPYALRAGGAAALPQAVHTGMDGGDLLLRTWATGAFLSLHIGVACTVGALPAASRVWLAYVVLQAAACAAAAVAAGIALSRAAGWSERRQAVFHVLVLGIVPAIQLATMACVDLTVRASLTAWPSPLFARLIVRLRVSLILFAVAWIAEVLLPCGAVTPESLLAVGFVGHAALLGQGYAQADALRPLGIAPQFGLLHQCLRQAMHVIAPRKGGWRFAKPTVLPWVPSATLSRTVAGGGVDHAFSRPEGPPGTLGPPPDVVHAASTMGVRAGMGAGATGHAEYPESVGSDLPPHLHLGVTLAFIRYFFHSHGFAPDAKSFEVRNLALEVTESSQRSLAELFSEDVTLGHPAVGVANLFVSHAHACRFLQMVDAVSAYLELHGLPEDMTFVWLDIFCIRQHCVEAEICHVGLVERAVGRVVVVLDPWDAPVCLTRVWCLFELLYSLHPAVDLDLTVPPDECARFVAALRRDPVAVEALLTSFDARNANVTVEADREVILSLIEDTFGGVYDDGLAQFNHETRGAIRAALAGFSWNM